MCLSLVLVNQENLMYIPIVRHKVMGLIFQLIFQIKEKSENLIFGQEI